VRFYIAQVAIALQHFHKMGISYLNLKPENVLLGGDGYVKLTDFGLQRLVHIKNNRFDFSYLGTKEYLAPETILGFEQNRNSDWWTLGVLV
jgi:serine/threonine protein kinase